MKINGIAFKIRDRVRFRSRSFLQAATPIPSAKTAKLDENYWSAKNVVLSGEFFPASDSFFKESLLKRNAHVQPQMTSETDILICGKYPDWMLVEEARHCGVTIIFIDKAGELFSRLASNLHKGRAALSYEEPLGV